MIPAPLYHYTCHHHADAIVRSGWLDVQARGLWDVLWLTDLDHPDRDGLGLTNHLLLCDRARFRFVVAAPVDVVRWVDVRRRYAPRVRAGLEESPGALPMHWYLTHSRQAVLLG